MHSTRAFNITAHRVGVTVAKVINISWGVFSPSKGKLFSLTAAQISGSRFGHFLDDLALKVRTVQKIWRSDHLRIVIQTLMDNLNTVYGRGGGSDIYAFYCQVKKICIGPDIEMLW